MLSIISSVVTILAFTTGISQFGSLTDALAGHLRNWLGHTPKLVALLVWDLGKLLWGCLVAAYRVVLLLVLPAVPSLSAVYLRALHTRLRTGRTPARSDDSPLFIALFMYLVAMMVFIVALNSNHELSLRLGMG